jgi:hypothetical protein
MVGRKSKESVLDKGTKWGDLGGEFCIKSAFNVHLGGAKFGRFTSYEPKLVQ